jgi:hypothetical protein
MEYSLPVLVRWSNWSDVIRGWWADDATWYRESMNDRENPKRGMSERSREGKSASESMKKSAMDESPPGTRSAHRNSDRGYQQGSRAVWKLGQLGPTSSTTKRPNKGSLTAALSLPLSRIDY